MSELTPPEAVRAKARAVGADAWLDGLAGLVAELADRWSLTVGHVYPDATEALVVAADLADGTPAVLKLLVPWASDGADREIAVLRLADGDGCVRLLDSDDGRGAMLLERLGPSMFSLGLPITRRHEFLADAAAALWRPVPDVELPTGAWKARRLAEQIEASWQRLGRPCSHAAIEHAVTCAARRELGHDDDRAVLVHGDVHQWNALQADEGSFKLVDPDGLRAEPEYDLGIIMREDSVELMEGDPRERARRLADRTGTDAEAIWEWGVVERVSNGLLCIEDGLQPFGDQSLAAADRIAAAER